MIEFIKWFVVGSVGMFLILKLSRSKYILIIHDLPDLGGLYQKKEKYTNRVITVKQKGFFFYKEINKFIICIDNKDLNTYLSLDYHEFDTLDEVKKRVKDIANVGVDKNGI